MHSTSFSQIVNMISEQVLDQINAQAQADKGAILRRIDTSEQKVLSVLSAVVADDSNTSAPPLPPLEQPTVNVMTSKKYNSKF